MSFTGAWRQKATTRSDGSGLRQPATVLGHPELGGLHVSADHDEDGSRVPFAPVPGAVPGYLPDPGNTYDPVTPGEAPGVVLGDQREQSHRAGTGVGGGQTREAARAEGNRLRSQDQGDGLRQVYRSVRTRGVTEQRVTEALEVTPINGGSRESVFLGRNSLPESNPDGFRNGVRIRRWQDRKIPGGGLRRHSLAPLRQQTAATPNVSPAPTGDQANRYAFPFTLNASSRRKVMQSPYQRRTPRAWDEDVVTDGSAQTNLTEPTFQSWGL